MITGATHPLSVGAAQRGRRRETPARLCTVCRSANVGPPISVCATCRGARDAAATKASDANGETAANTARAVKSYRAAIEITAEREGVSLFKTKGVLDNRIRKATEKLLHSVGSDPLAFALPSVPVIPKAGEASSSKQSSPIVDLVKSNSVSRISEEKHLPNTYSTPTSTPTSGRIPSVERIAVAILASVQDSNDALGHIAAEGKVAARMRFQEMAKHWSQEEKLIHRGFKSPARASGFRRIWGMAYRHAKAGNQWFPIKESYLREKLGYQDKSSIYDLIETLCELAVLVPHPVNGAVDSNLYRWALPTNIWETQDDENPF